jgi:hypothetical protein
MIPKVAQVSANGLWLAVDQVIRQTKLVKCLIPEFALRIFLKDAFTNAGQRRGKDQGDDPLGHSMRQRLRDPAADVVAAQHDSIEAQLFDELDDTSGLGIRAVELTRFDEVLVRLTKATQIGNYHVGYVGEVGHH